MEDTLIEREEITQQETFGPRIGLSICFAISGILFFVLLLDSHYKTVSKEVIQNAFGKAKK